MHTFDLSVVVQPDHHSDSSFAQQDVGSVAPVWHGLHEVYGLFVHACDMYVLVRLCVSVCPCTSTVGPGCASHCNG